MKTIAYSEVPQRHSYVHLAYLSANSEPAGIALATILMIAIPYFLVYVVGSATKLNLQFPKAWRLLAIAVVTVTAGLLLFSLLSPMLGR